MSVDRSVMAVTIYVAVVEHRSGLDTWVATTMAGLYDMLYEYVDAYWCDWDLADQKIPTNRETAVKQYFDYTSQQDKGEYLMIATHSVIVGRD